MNYEKFEIAFWHPFGPAARETPEEIIKRKRDEIGANGYTLWSFQYRRMLVDWHRELSAAKPSAVFVFCSEGHGAVDPAREGTLSRPMECQSYRFIGEEHTEWRPMPGKVRVPHPFRPGKKLASAFVVQRVIYPVQPFERPAVKWFSKEGRWCETMRIGVPTRGEYLIRRGGTFPMRSVRLVLELKPPYLAEVMAGEGKISK
ncbi:MAG: hypothetical protein HY648_05385 [Acidobacteria bacterium]|nr:hypothetical protein [Acidobacteriota bacterium]